MPEPFTAYRIHQRDRGVEARFEQLTLEDLSPGEVVIRVSHSSINYKDALAATGKGRILRRYPLVGGIDLAGSVEQSSDPAYKRGAAVLVTGCGLSETRDGGYAQFARVPASAVVAMVWMRSRRWRSAPPASPRRAASCAWKSTARRRRWDR
jgi:NADPH:quinone reductase-like Zn-dependent oxidoreductase